MQDECKNVLTEKVKSEDGTGNFASVLRDQEGKEVQKTEVAFVGIGRNLVSIVVAIRGTLSVAVKLNESKELYIPLVS